ARRAHGGLGRTGPPPRPEGHDRAARGAPSVDRRAGRPGRPAAGRNGGRRRDALRGDGARPPLRGRAVGPRRGTGRLVSATPETPPRTGPDPTQGWRGVAAEDRD